MAAYPGEDEELEAIKRWWSEYGNSILIAIAIVVLGTLSWRTWQNSGEASAQEASQLYQQIADAAGGIPVPQLTEEEFSTLEFLNEQLHSDFADSMYARYASLFMARLYVDAGNLESAADELSWILDNPEIGMFNEAGEEILLTARLRLARVVLAQGNTERALQLVTNVDPGPYAAGYLEVEGDIYLSMGQVEQARTVYLEAIANGANSAILQLKLRDIGGA